MPYHFVEDTKACPVSKPWAVKNKDTGRLMGCHPTKEKARKHVGALMTHVPDAQRVADTPNDMGEHNSFYRVAPPSNLILREDGGEAIVEGMVVPYGQWTEVDSVLEGHFFERFAAGSLRKTFTESIRKMKGYFEHGRSRMFERAPIMDITDAWEEDGGAFFRANLLAGIPGFVVDGIRKGLYGASIGAEPVNVERTRNPGKSDHNPKGIEERTYKELRAFDISLTPTPHYEEAAVMMRSITDKLAVEALVKEPERLLQLLRESQETPVQEEQPEEPEHSEPDEPEAPPEPGTEPEPELEEASRSTQPPVKDYLADETEEEWRL